MTYRAHSSKAGHSLMELMIALSIMVIVIAAVVDSLSGSVNFSYMVDQNTQRMESLDTIRSMVGADFNESALYLQYDPSVMSAYVNPVTNGPNVIFPNIIQGGREIQFTRFRTSITANEDPTTDVPYYENMVTSTAVPLSQYGAASESPFFIINPNSQTPGNWNVCPVWDSNIPANSFIENCGIYTGGSATATTGYSEPRLEVRLWRYVVIPFSPTCPTSIATGTTWPLTAYPLDPQVGPTIVRGMLLRQYLNAPDASNPAPAWITVGTPLNSNIIFDIHNLEYPATALPCFIFGSAYDGVTRTGDQAIASNEIRLKVSVFQQMYQNNQPLQYNLIYSFPFQIIDYGE